MSAIKQPDTLSSAIGRRWTYKPRGYALSQSIRQLKRHRLASLLTLTVLGITLALPVMLSFANSGLSKLAQNSQARESLTAYLSLEVSDADGAALADSWRGLPGIADTAYITRDQALNQLKEQADIDDTLSLIGGNPLPGAIVVFPDSTSLETSRLNKLADSLTSNAAVDQVQLDLKWVKRLQAVASLIQLISLLMAVFLTLTAILVISNTVRLELARRRSEIDVANLLGAPPRFMNRSLIYSGALYGLLGGTIACILGLLAFNAIRKPADSLSSMYGSTFQLALPSVSQIVITLGLTVILGMLGAAGSLYRPGSQLTHR